MPGPEATGAPRGGPWSRTEGRVRAGDSRCSLSVPRRSGKAAAPGPGGAGTGHCGAPNSVRGAGRRRGSAWREEGAAGAERWGAALPGRRGSALWEAACVQVRRGCGAGARSGSFASPPTPSRRRHNRSLPLQFLSRSLPILFWTPSPFVLTPQPRPSSSLPLSSLRVTHWLPLGVRSLEGAISLSPDSQLRPPESSKRPGSVD